MTADFHVTYKFLILGDTSVGKTSFIEKYSKNTFNFNQKSTVGIDYSILTSSYDNKNIKLQIWDTAGQERYRSIVKSFYQGSHGILLMYDITNPSTFEGISNWMKEIKEKNGEVALVLCGNKCDLEETQRKVDKQRGYELAKSLDVPFFETSASFSINIQEAFSALVERTYKKFGLLNQDSKSTRLEEKDSKTSGRCC